MASDQHKARTIDVDFELFWRQVGEAATMVEYDRTKEISVQVGDKKADISWAEWESDQPPFEGVQIEVYETEVTRTPLIAE